MKMDFRCLEFLVVFVFLQGICGLPLGEKASEMQRNVLFEVCTHNGTSYWEGETVRIEDPCLSCVCRRGALECSLRVCADEPNVLPPGCFFVHKPNDCCPQLFCEEEESSNPVGVELRTNFKLENKQNGNDCAINGSLYAEGSAVASTGHCEYCYCIEGEMKCLKPRCLRSFEGCRPIYEKSSCCPTQYDCRDADLESLQAQVKSFALSNSGSKRPRDDSPRTLADSTESLNSNETAENPREELPTTTEEPATDKTTVKPDKEMTTLSSEDFLTSVGFQTVIDENSNSETTTTVSLTEETTPIETTTEDVEEKMEPLRRGDFPAGIDSSVASNDESRDNSSQEVDEYDSYDYGEPRLPPSLPNLVIFPFVAADAVVKDETEDALGVQDKSEIKRIDAYPVFYKDHFSPPIKTEGGFVPKEPVGSIEPFYEFGYVRKEQIESPGINLNEAVICQDVVCPPANGINLSVLEDTQPTTAGHVNATFEGDTKTSFDFKEEPMEFDKIPQNKKPVTVTYKNVVVDFYPNYLITTTRARPKTQPSIAAAIAEESVTVDDEANPSTPPIKRTTEKSSFFDEFLKSFFSEEVEETTTEAIMRTRPNHKYSSKIRGQANASMEKREEVPSNDSLLNFLVQPEEAVASKQKIYSSTLKYVKKEGTKSFTKTSFREPSATTVSEEGITDENKNGAGALLKLAGCNIYGMMYRVGKVIMELSGPCLECLCTDSGVQCRPLKC